MAVTSVFMERERGASNILSSGTYLCLSFSVFCVSLTVSITLFQFLVSCRSCPGLIVVPLSLAIMLSFVPADQIPIRTEQISYFHLALMKVTSPKLLVFFQARTLHYLSEREAMLFPSFPSDADVSFSNQSRFNQGSLLCGRSRCKALGRGSTEGGNQKHR